MTSNQPSTELLELIEAGVPALSIRQPWAWAIIEAGKDIENRTWRHAPKYRGPVLIHASKNWDYDVTDEEQRFMFQIEVHEAEGEAIVPDTMHRGGIIGVVDLVDVVTQSNSLWFHGPLGLVVRNPRPLPFFPCRGTLGFFRIDVGVAS